MRINEILAASVIREAAPGSFGAQAGVFARALGQGITQAMLPGANTAAGAQAAAVDRMASAAALAAPIIQQQAKEQMSKWNDSVRFAMQQANVSHPDQLPGQQKQALGRSLMDTMNKQISDRLDNFKNLPQWVDQKGQSKARQTVASIEQSIAKILNWRNPAKSSAEQLEHWQDLMQAVYDANSLVQFRPAAAKARVSSTPLPAITLAPNGNFRIGRFQINPAANPLMKTIGTIIIDQTQQPSGSPAVAPKITISPTGEYLIGDYVLDQNEPAEALAAQIIKSERAGGTV